MKSSMEKRLQSLESASKLDQRPKSALVVCDPDILYTFDFSFVEADHVLILPDNGRGFPEDQPIAKGSYFICYS